MGKTASWVIALHVAIVAIGTLASAGVVVAESPAPSVMIVEAVDSDLGYAVILAGSESSQSADVMAVMRSVFENGSRIAVLIAPDAPVRAFTTIRSMASKVGYARNDMRFFAFDGKKRGMVAVDLQAGWIDYQIDGTALSEYFE